MTDIIRLQNSLNDSNIQLSRYIDKSNYFILCATFATNAENDIEYIKSLSKNILEGKYIDTLDVLNTQPPLSIYSYTNGIIMLFSNMPNSSHFYNGSHQHIISYFSSRMSLLFNKIVNCTILEFSTRTKLLIFFHTLIFQHQIDFLIQALKQQLNDKGKLIKNNMPIIDHFLLDKLILDDAIEYYGRENWESLHKHIKFGVFIKLKKQPSKTHQFQIISEFFDMNKNYEKYETFFFE